jgi:hypothetical protein
MVLDLTVTLPALHTKQEEIKQSHVKRKVIRAGRRGGKTTLAADIAVDEFLDGGRILYATPTQEQIDRFWLASKNSLKEALDAGVYYKNETKHIIELRDTEQRIRGKTAWNADTLRGDYGDVVILDEFQDMDPDTLELVVYPMLLDTDGDLIVIYTKKRGLKGKHASELYKRAEKDTTGRWGAFHFTSHDNPYLSLEALEEITQDMTNLAYRMEIMAEEIDDDPFALWNRELINATRLTKHPVLYRVVVGVDPPGGPNTECGIVVAGAAYVNDELNAFILDDRSVKGSPGEWGKAVVTGYHRNLADRVLGEANFGGDMVENTIRTVDETVAYKPIHASRGKAVRAEPVVAWYEKGRVHHVGEFPELEDEQCNWVPNSRMPSPNRVDALVWAVTDLLGGGVPRVLFGA